jgi:hypothetical protein
VNLLTLERERGGGNFGVDKYHQCIKCYSFVTKSWECKKYLSYRTEALQIQLCGAFVCTKVVRAKSEVAPRD